MAIENQRQRRRSLSDIKTVLRSKKKAMPKVAGSETLERFILEKNRDRLGQERANIEKRLARIDKEIAVIDDELGKIEDNVSQDENKTINRANHEKREYGEKMKKMKKINIDY